MNTAQAASSGPWWKYGYMWLVLGGPAIVVVASFYLLYLAVSGQDPVDPSYFESQQISAPVDAAHKPARHVRNHAATAGKDRSDESVKP